MKDHSSQPEIPRRGSATGSTLIEIILALSVGAMLTVVLAMCFVVIFETETRTEGGRELREQGTQIMGLVTQAIRNADVINEPAPAYAMNAFSVTPIGASEASSVTLRDRRLWLIEGAYPEVAFSNSRVTVEEFTVTNLTQNGGAGTLSIQLRLSVPLQINSPSARTATYTLRASATLRSQETAP